MIDHAESDQLHGRGLRELHLFAGGGGGILGGLLLGHHPICAVEINRYCRKILRRRIKDKILPWFPIFKDVREFDGRPWRKVTDIVCAGFPCQPFSTAGKQAGEADKRNLWPETIRIIREVGPKISFLENVPRLVTFDYFGTILGDLADAGYDAEWGVVSAASVGAPHLRKRLWIMAWNPNNFRKEPQRRMEKGKNPHVTGICQGSYSGSLRRDTGGTEQSLQRIGASSEARKGSNSAGKRLSGSWQSDHALHSETATRREATELVDGSITRIWQSEPSVGRVVNGLPNQLDRIRTLGNAQVPSVVAAAFLILAHRIGLSVWSSSDY